MADSDRPNGEERPRSDPAHQVAAAGLVALVASVRALRKEAERVSALPFRAQEDEKFCHELVTLMQSIQDRFTIWGWGATLKLFPLLQIPQRYDSGYDLGKRDLLSQLEQTLRLLEEQLRLVDLRSFLTVANSSQVGELLRAARARKNESQGQAAAELGMSADSVKAWESGRQHPAGENVGKVADYITSAFSDTRC